MTTLAIIGSGILGRSLVYTLAKEQRPFQKIILFHSDKFAPPCSLSSTAIVAPRGVTTGHSPLGDLIVEGFKTFSDHIHLDQPAGVEKITLYTAANSKLETFKKRYPSGALEKGFLKEETYTAKEEAFLVDPEVYGNWLLSEASLMEQVHLELIDDFVTDIQEGERLHIKTVSGRHFSPDKIVFAGGAYNRWWKEFAPAVLESSRPVQGSYYEFNGVEWDLPSFSLTLDGDNLIWNNARRRLLVGSTTLETVHMLPECEELKRIYERLSRAVVLKLPGRELAVIKTGLREKARKREPYIHKKDNLIFAGGLYKNGFSLSLKISRNLSHQYL